MPAERAPDVEQLVKDMNRAYKEGDLEFISRHTSKDPAAIAVGSDASEVSRGFDEIVDLMRPELSQRTPDSPALSIDEIDAYREGEIAWATMFGTFAPGENGAIPARAIGVFRREDGDWKMVAWLFSFAVPNEALESGSPVLERLAVAKV
jgi:hypothetical protein